MPAIDGNTKLLLHCDGADGSSSFPDSSWSNHTVTLSGSPVVDTDQSQFGGASAMFSASDALLLDGGADFVFGAGDFTIDFRLQLRSFPTDPDNPALAVLYDGRADSLESIVPALWLDSGVLTYHVNGVDQIVGATTLDVNVWYHVALTRGLSTTRLFLNGVQEGGTYTDTNSYNINPARPAIGDSGYDLANGAGLDGWIDELQVSKGVARWTANFTPPTEAYGPAAIVNLVAASLVTGSPVLDTPVIAGPSVVDLVAVSLVTGSPELGTPTAGVPGQLPPSRSVYVYLGDRHVRRSGDDYGTQFLTLLPQGQAWPKYPGTTLDLACRGLAEYWGYVDGRAADLLEIESDPRKTVELLPDWERNWGLPDPCYAAPDSIAARQLALVMRMTMQGSQSREFFIGVAAQIGYSISITEYRVFVVGIDRCGDNRVYGDGSDPMFNEWDQPIKDPAGNNVALGELSEWPNYGIGPPENRFYWTVHVHSISLIWFRCSVSECGVDPHLTIGTAEDLECILNRWKPAHTQIIFDYSGVSSGGDMAGTP